MPHALHFLVLTVAGWVNSHQEDLTDYLREENRVLRELGRRPLQLTDAQRRRRAVCGQKLGRPRNWFSVRSCSGSRSHAARNASFVSSGIG